MNTILNKGKTIIFLLLNLYLWSPMVSSATKEFSVTSIIFHFQKNLHYIWVTLAGTYTFILNLFFLYLLEKPESYLL